MLNIQNVKVKVEQGFEKICPFPVGYVYQSMEDTSPAEVFGGTWTKVDDGRYLRAASDSKTGGSDTISVSQMPSHTHAFGSNVVYTTGESGTKPCLPGSQDINPWWTVWANNRSVSSTGGGNRSTPRIRMCTRGIGCLSKRVGDALWHSLTFLKSSILWERFTSRLSQRLPLKSSEARGLKSQMEDSGDRQILTEPLADKIRLRLPKTIFLVVFGMLGETLTPITIISLVLLMKVVFLVFSLETEKALPPHFKQFLSIAPVIVGLESPSILAVG